MKMIIMKIRHCLQYNNIVFHTLAFSLIRNMLQENCGALFQLTLLFISNRLPVFSVIFPKTNIILTTITRQFSKPARSNIINNKLYLFYHISFTVNNQVLMQSTLKC